ncbi:hypothetical protein KFL_000180105 [Klebsormidium nitens]|uniref:Uncharacterized protein n=1 Tax=Klebsormidium nitens TaxID=105231 RepID=A0A1Y1HQ89_KLENI|nr:hypothetical protein KFL_000180105 [Klebsormidium nitens]|eukprot:GAQ78727.1 hypothetical protein KFL_000180105 [Klebsormidium nitens]
MRRRPDSTMHPLARLPPLRLALLLFFAFLACTLTVFLSVRNQTYTAFRWRAAATRAMHHHDRALVTSTHFLNSLSDDQLQQWKPAHQPAVTMVVLTCHRAVPYINVLVASLLQGQSAEELADGFRVRLLNVERDPVLRDSHEARLLRRIPLLQYQDAAANRIETNETWVARGVKDYMTALRACQVGVPTPWCIIIEEDALLTSDFVWKFKEGVVGVLGDGAKTTAFVKLWTTDWWDGFENEDWPKLALVVVASAGLLTAVVDCLCCTERRRGSHALPLTLCFAFFVITIAVNLWIVNAQLLSQIGEQPGVYSSGGIEKNAGDFLWLKQDSRFVDR